MKYDEISIDFIDVRSDLSSDKKILMGRSGEIGYEITYNKKSGKVVGLKEYNLKRNKFPISIVSPSFLSPSLARRIVEPATYHLRVKLYKLLNSRKIKIYQVGIKEAEEDLGKSLEMVDMEGNIKFLEASNLEELTRRAYDLGANAIVNVETFRKGIFKDRVRGTPVKFS